MSCTSIHTDQRDSDGSDIHFLSMGCGKSRDYNFETNRCESERLDMLSYRQLLCVCNEDYCNIGKPTSGFMTLQNVARVSVSLDKDPQENLLCYECQGQGFDCAIPSGG